jgi:DNA mismatch endonuclease (patch repair protein)
MPIPEPEATPAPGQRRRRGASTLKLTKSEQMARVKSRNTKPELSLRKALWARGGRYRVHAGLPGSPDIVFRGARLAIFVDGCFWHGCPKHYTAPRANAGFWTAKIERNRARDRRVDRELVADGWYVLRLWEHEIEASLPMVLERVFEALNRPERA